MNNKTAGKEEREQEIWSWGAGTEGQLGSGRLQDEDTPQLLHSLSSFGPISSLSCGGAHVIALTPGTTTILCVHCVCERFTFCLMFS